MSRAFLSVIGMLSQREDLFDLLQVPEEMDSSDVADVVAMECAELELVYTDPDFLKRAIGVWSSHRQPIWQKMYETTAYEYNPLWNKDATITDTETVERGQTVEGTTSASSEKSSTGSRSGNQVHEVTGFNSAELATDSKDTTSASDTMNVEGNDSSSSSEELAEDITRTRTHRETGNIGVTSTMQLIKEQRDIINYDVAEIIAEEFRRKFCILVY